MHHHSPLSCDCKSGNRTLVLLANDFSEMFPEFSIFGANENWNYLSDYGIVQIEVGTGRRFSGAADVLNFLRTAITDRTRLENLRAVWFDRRQSVTRQLVRLGAEGRTDYAVCDGGRRRVGTARYSAKPPHRIVVSADY